MGWTKKSYDALFGWLDVSKRPKIAQILVADGLPSVVDRLTGSGNMGTWYRIVQEAAVAVGPEIVDRSAGEAEAELNRIVAMSELVCHRCGHRWYPLPNRDATKVCPKCKSPYWDRPRRGIGP